MLDKELGKNALGGLITALNGVQVGVVALLLFTLIPALVLGQAGPKVKATVISKERNLPPSASYLRPSYKCAVDSDAFASRVFAEYGALIVASGVQAPDRCIFEDEKAVTTFQERLKTSSVPIRGTLIELQQAAMLALLDAQAEASLANRRITPLDGVIAGKRSMSDTIRLWNSRFSPALNYWVRKGRISPKEAEAVRGAQIADQVRRVIDWERQGLYFSTGFSRSIFSSVAPPGTSQHLSMLALDVVEYHDRTVVSILNSHGWYQTVVNDEPHFTFLGLPETELPSKGLKPVIKRGSKFWVPNLPIDPHSVR